MENNNLKIEYVPIDSLIPYDKNARKHKPQDVSKIVNSIKEFGMCDPIGVWGKNNIIVEGHGRLMALKELDYKEVPVIHLDHLTDKQRKAYALAHNRTAELSSWDQELLINELIDLKDDFVLDDFGFSDDLYIKDEKDAVDDNFNVDDEYNKIKEPKAKLGDVYQLGDHRLMCGDSTKEEDVEKLVEGGVNRFIAYRSSLQC